MDPMQQMLSSLTDFNYIPYCVYRIAMKLRFIQKKTRCKSIRITYLQKTGSITLASNFSMSFDCAHVASDHGGSLSGEPEPCAGARGDRFSRLYFS